MRYAFDIPRFLDWVVSTWAPVGSLATRAAYSRSHFSRVFASEVGETARTLRQRLQLEAGAHLLKRSEFSVGEIAVEVGYATPEAFTKAFTKAFGASPSEFRRSDADSSWLETTTGIHFHPSGLIVRREGATQMTFTQTLVRHHADEVTTILKAMASLGDDELDREVVYQGDEIPFDKHDKTLRGVMEAIVFTQEVWMAAMRGDVECPAQGTRATVSQLTQRHEESSKSLIEFVKEVEDKDMWSSEFVDALCPQPERFRFDAVLAHILVFSAHRRQMALAALRSLGVDSLGYGDPIVWLRTAV